MLDWLASAALLRLESTVFHRVVVLPSWLHWVLIALLTARTFVLLSELSTRREAAYPKGPPDAVLLVVHGLAFVLAVLLAQTSAGDAMALVALASWLVLTTPLSDWRKSAGAQTALHTAGLVVGAMVAAGMPVVRQLWTRLDENPDAHSLSVWTLRAVHGLVATLDSTATFDPEHLVIGVHGFEVRVAPACAGIEGMGLVALFLAGYIAAFHRSLRFPRALLLLPVGLVLTFVFNLVRIASMLFLGGYGSPDIAVAGFHSRAGWLAFNGVAVGLAAIGRTSLLSSTQDETPSRERNAVAPYLMPVLAFLAASLVSEAASSGFERLYGLRVLAVAVVVWIYRHEYRVLPWKVSWQAIGLGAAVFVLWMALPRPVSDRHVADGLAHLSNAAATLWIILRIAGSVLVAPFAEELAFRAWLPRRMLAQDFESVPLQRFTSPTIAVSSIAFGVLHGRWFAGAIAGVLYALALRRRGSVGDAVVAHATTNGLLCVWAVVVHDWSVM